VSFCGKFSLTAQIEKSGDKIYFLPLIFKQIKISSIIRPLKADNLYPGTANNFRDNTRIVF
jgi:hypothetical protein